MEYFTGTMGFLFAGDFHINTGYDDPSGVGDNLAIAREHYSAQVFATNANISPYSGANPVEIRISATPTFGCTLTPGSPPAQVARVWLKCSVWISCANRDHQSNVQLTNVSWALYRL